MERYDCTIKEHLGRREMWGAELRGMPELAATVELVERHLGADSTCDLHGGNVMWSKARQELVITDTSSAEYTGSCTNTIRSMTSPRELAGLRLHVEAIGQPRRMVELRPARAQWKLPPLQQQFHMRVQ
jgi:hypothetical protein